MLKTNLLFTENEELASKLVVFYSLNDIRARLSSPFLHNFGEPNYKNERTSEIVDSFQKRKQKKVKFLKAVFRFLSSEAFSVDICIHGSFSSDSNQK